MRFKRRTIAFFLLAIAPALILSSCSSDLGYYSQAVQGHLDIMARRQPIDLVLANAATSRDLREKLSLVLSIREFASRELLLPDNGSYRSYVDLQRPEVVWNVVAAPEFSLLPRQWCFPVAGCVAYRGYYSRESADALSEKLKGEGEDVYLYGVDAYSTLGWFDDPVLNTFLDQSPVRVAELIFHELAHQKLYIKGDSAFNEAFAEAVAHEGVARWLKLSGQQEKLVGWEEASRREDQFVSLLQEARGRLEKLYAGEGDSAIKRAGKARVFSEMEQAYNRLKESWGGYGGYDKWFASPVNNARLTSIGTYRNQLPAFQSLLSRQGGDLTAFYREVDLLARLPKGERQKRMLDLAAETSRISGPDMAGLWDVTTGDITPGG